MSNYYKIVRHFQNGRKYTIFQLVTLEEAQTHTKSPETSSQTATSATAKARTRKHGLWFDAFHPA